MKPPLWSRLVYYAALILVIAGLTHFASLLLVPALAERDAFARVRLLVDAPFQTVALPPASPGGKAFPYADPAVAAAVCRYDLSGGPVRVRAPLTRPGFASLVSFAARRNLYALTDRAATKGRMDALIVTQEQLRVLVSRDDEDNPSDDLRIVSPTKEGFVMMRALSNSPDDLPSAAEEAGAMSCSSEPIAEAEK